MGEFRVKYNYGNPLAHGDHNERKTIGVTQLAPKTCRVSKTLQVCTNQ